MCLNIWTFKVLTLWSMKLFSSTYTCISLILTASIHDPENPSVLIEGVLFRAQYLGSTQLISEGQPSKAMRMMQAQEAVGRIKVRRLLMKKLGSVCSGNGIYIRLNSLWQIVGLLILFHYLAYYKPDWLTWNKSTFYWSF